MSDAQEAAKERRRKAFEERMILSKALDEFFAGTAGELAWEEIRKISGDEHPAFSAKEGFNANGAAFRDGMRATFLEIKKLRNFHKEENHE